MAFRARVIFYGKDIIYLIFCTKFMEISTKYFLVLKVWENNILYVMKKRDCATATYFVS